MGLDRRRLFASAGGAGFVANAAFPGVARAEPAKMAPMRSMGDIRAALARKGVTVS